MCLLEDDGVAVEFRGFRVVLEGVNDEYAAEAG
jgi:hypothetical protein